MKSTFILVLLCLFSTKSLAQSFDLYAIAGPVLSQIDGDRLGGYNKVGGMFGIGLKRGLKLENAYLTLEFDYIQKGKGSYNNTEGNSYKTVFDYINFPFLLRYQLPSKYSLEAGVSSAILIKYKFLHNGESNEAPSYTPQLFDINYMIGGSYSFSSEWSIHLRFAQSIFAIGDKTPNDTYRPSIWINPGGMYNRSLSLALAYDF